MWACAIAAIDTFYLLVPHIDLSRSIVTIKFNLPNTHILTFCAQFSFVQPNQIPIFIIIRHGDGGIMVWEGVLFFCQDIEVNSK